MRFGRCYCGAPLHRAAQSTTRCSPFHRIGAGCNTQQQQHLAFAALHNTPLQFCSRRAAKLTGCSETDGIALFLATTGTQQRGGTCDR